MHWIHAQILPLTQICKCNCSRHTHACTQRCSPAPRRGLNSRSLFLQNNKTRWSTDYVSFVVISLQKPRIQQQQQEQQQQKLDLMSLESLHLLDITEAQGRGQGLKPFGQWTQQEAIRSSSTGLTSNISGSQCGISPISLYLAPATLSCKSSTFFKIVNKRERERERGKSGICLYTSCGLILFPVLHFASSTAWFAFSIWPRR